jgi:uncharacterized protein YndB with AHSA1/START domain
MSTATQLQNDTEEFVIARSFEAPRELVWKCFTEPERMAQWWGPKGFRAEIMKLEPWPGGIYHYVMRSAGGQEMWGKFVYREVAPPERMVLINSFSDEHENVVRPPFAEDWPLRMLTVFTFTEENGRTTVTVNWRPYEATEEECRTFDRNRESMRAGWTGSLDVLERYLAKVQGR